MMIISIAREPGAEIVAIGSSHGNCSARQAALNAIRVLDLLGMDSVPVAVGLESPLREPIDALHVHGNDGLGEAGVPRPSRSPVDEGAVDQLLRLSAEHPGELDLLVVGGMTNIAAALERDRSVLSRFRSVWTLGGYSRRPDPSDSPSEDFNVYCSPAAADRVFTAQSGINVVPIDTTFRVILSDEHLQKIHSARTPVGEFVNRILETYLDFYQERMGHRTIPVHDPVVPALLLHPSLIRASESRAMLIEATEDKHRAVGVEPDGRRPSQTVIIDVDSRSLLDRLVDAIERPPDVVLDPL